MLDPITMAVIAAGSGILNALSGEQQRKQTQNKINNAIEQLKKLKISEQSKAKRIDQYTDVYNSSVINQLNSQLPLNNNILNSGVIGASIIGKSMPGYLQNIAQLSSQIDEYNSNINSKITELSLGIPTDNSLNNFLAGGVTGLQLALGIDDAFKNTKYEEILKKVTDKLQNPTSTSEDKNNPIVNPNQSSPIPTPATNNPQKSNNDTGSIFNLNLMPLGTVIPNSRYNQSEPIETNSFFFGETQYPYKGSFFS